MTSGTQHDGDTVTRTGTQCDIRDTVGHSGMLGTQCDKDRKKGRVEDSGGPAAAAEMMGLSHFMLT